jgi:hypothetical protein
LPSLLYRHRRLLLVTALLLVSLLTVNFAVRAFDHGRRFRARADEPIQTWMNVPYISRAYRVPPPVVAAAIGLRPEQRDRRPIKEIAQEQGRDPTTLIADIMAAIERERALRRPPGNGPPPAPEAQP